MRHRSRLAGLLASVLYVTGAAFALDSAPAPDEHRKALASNGMTFTKNNGQWPEDVLFRADAGGAAVWYCLDKVVYQFVRPSASHAPQSDLSDPSMLRREAPPVPIEELVVTARFEGSNPGVTVGGEQLIDYKCNYFYGNDPFAWRTDVPNYRAIVYHDLYPGIDLNVSADRGLEYVMRSGADPNLVRITYEGIDNQSISEEGSVTLTTAWGKIGGVIVTPAQLSAEIDFEMSGSESAVASYRSSVSAVTLLYSTFLGTSSYDEATAIAVDSLGATYIGGITTSITFPTLNPFQSVGGGTNYDGFVTKLNSAGTALEYSTYLGDGSSTSWVTRVTDLALTPDGDLWLTGEAATNFPTVNPLITDPDGTIPDAFATKMSSTGNSLLFSTYLGGTGDDYGNGIAVDTAGNAYVCGRSFSADFPTVTPIQATLLGFTDGFVTKINATGTTIAYSTYLGGTDGEEAQDLAVDASGNAYVTGYTASSDFPVVNAYQSASTTFAAFVSKITASGNALSFSTYLGGSGSEFAYGIAVDAAGAAYVTGKTESSDFPLVNAYQNTLNPLGDMFVTKFAPSGLTLEYSTFYGGDAAEQGEAIAVHSSGVAYVTGRTNSTDFPTFNEYQTNQTGYDAVVCALNPTGDDVLFSTYLGGSTTEGSSTGWPTFRAAVAEDGACYVVGTTYSADFPTLNAYDATHNGSPDAYIAKLLPPPAGCCLPASLLRGDLALPSDGTTDGSDLGVCVDYIFFNDESAITTCAEHRDINNDASFDGGDLGVLVDYIFFGDTAIIVRCDGSPF